MAAGIANKIAALALAGAAAPGLFHNGSAMPVLGVQLTTVACCFFGTVAAVGYDDKPTPPMGKLAFFSLSNIVVSAAVVGWVPGQIGWSFSSTGTEGAFGVLVALALYYLVPPAKTRAVEIIREFKPTEWLPFLNKRAANVPEPTAPAAPPAQKPGTDIGDPDA